MAEKAKSDNGTAAGSRHTPRAEKPRGRRKTRIGYVVSDKMQKTIVVERGEALLLRANLFSILTREGGC